MRRRDGSPVSYSTPIQPVASPSPRLERRTLHLRLDPLLTLAVLGLCACSVLTIRSATSDDIAGQPSYYVIRQALYVGVGLVLMYGVSRIDYSRLRELKYPIYGLMIASIALVYALATATRGSKRWIELPFFRFQPSELGKILLVLAISAFITDRMRRFDRDTTARVVLLALFPAMLVMAQPDLGTSLVYIVGILALLFVAGAPWKHFAALAALGAVAITVSLVALPAAGVELLKPYQTARLTAFLDPSGNPGDEGYQQQQSKIAIGSGEKTGRGVENSTQTSLNFLPEHHTDFIFAVVGETYGFAGAALVLSLYALLVWRGLHILTIAKNLYGALIAGGITVMLLFQIFVNVGMTVGIMPITGVPAPLLSFGGSSMLVTFLAIGLLQSISAQARETAASKGRAPLFQ
ncbi:MAG: rod shape-determining protein RodA [Solirubrobacterales bacterium]|jgi:rod shape determining protein RodA|nr:rod shape-determining protein RodA [Solirubrobacterales bacterium]